MKYNINHIDDIRPYIKEDTGIVVVERGAYTVIDYVYVMEETFNSPASLQCRGIKFDSDGNVIARPFHKFFNVGEKEQQNEIDWQKPHIILDKLDGSFVHPALIDDKLVFMTRMGITEQAKQALACASQGILDFCYELMKSKITPLFEYTAPDNRIVIKYDTTSITLLAARHFNSGEYVPYDDLRKLSDKFKIPLVTNHGSIDDPKSFIEESRKITGKEGFVIMFEDGHCLKLKADDYVLKHKTKADMSIEKNILRVILENKADDIISILDDDITNHILEYETSVFAGIEHQTKIITAFYEEHKHKERKEYAAQVMKTIDANLRSVAFKALDGESIREALVKNLLKATSSTSNVDNIRYLFDFEWNIDGVNFGKN